MKKSKEQKEKKVRNLRKLRYGAASTAVTVVVIAAVVLLNVLVGILADRYPISLDLSKDKIFSLSDESVKIAQNVKDDLDIVVFSPEKEFSEPSAGSQSGVAEFDTTMKEFYNALRQLRAESDGHIRYSFIDPDQQPTQFAKYSSYDVQSNDILFLYGDRSKVCSVSDLYALDTSNYYTTGSYSFESKVEKTLASAIHNLTGGEEHIVQVLVGHEEDSNTIAGLKSLYELNGYTFKEVTITGSAAFDEKAEIMLIAAPEKDYSDSEIKRVQQWYYNDGNYGRHLMVYVSPTASCPNLYEFLNVEYKIQVSDELLLETDLNRVQNYNQLYTMCDVPSTDLTPNSASTGKVLTLQARRLTTTLPEKDGDGTNATYGVQLTSYPDSARLIKLQDYSDQNADGTYAADKDAYPLSSMIACVNTGFNSNTQESVEGSVIVSGCSTIAYEQITGNAVFKNEELLLDAANTMTGADSGVTISNKSLSADTVTFSGSAQLILGLAVFTVGLPLIILVICLIVFIRRKNL